MNTKGWISQDNLHPFMLILAKVVFCKFDETEWEEVRYGVSRTSDEKSEWFDYKLNGLYTVTLRLARDANADVILYELIFPDELHNKIESAIAEL